MVAAPPQDLSKPELADSAPRPGGATQDAVVLPPLRPDLVVTKQTFEKRTFYVVKDPISLQYFRMTAEDYLLASLFNGRRTFAQIREAYQSACPHVRLDYSPEELNERILRFANDLALLQFLSVQGARLRSRWEHSKKNRKKKGGLYELANTIFFFRRSMFDPDRLFARMAKPLAWMWTRQTLWISMGLMAAALVVFFSRVKHLDQALANLFQWDNIALMWVTTIALKSIHELGHGLTCKHFGGEVHEVGFMSMVFTPYFFVNVSDCWTMPNRLHRILVSAAGIYVELIFASLATFLWAVVQPGWFQNFLFNVIVITSVSTLIFNANPLMRFDGYYILTDLIEIPNLQGKARTLIQHKLHRLLFGPSQKDEALSRLPLPRQRLAFFYTYAILSWLYGYWVIYKLIVFMEPHLAPLGLEGMSFWFSTLALTSWVVVPIFGFFKSMQLSAADLQPGGRIRRLTNLLAPAVGLFLLCCLIPVPLHIRRAGAVQLAQPDQIRPLVTGFITEVFVREGDSVSQGQPVARLQNREITQNLAAAEARLKSAEANVQRALGTDKPAEQIQAESMRAAFQARFEETSHDAQQLLLKAPRNGTVLTANLHQKLGQLARSNELFCEIAPLDPMRIKIALNEKEVRHVQTGQQVTLRANAYPGKTFHGLVESDPVMFFGETIPPAFSARRSGDVPVFVDGKGHDVPLERTYEAVVLVQNPERLLRPGMTVRAKIYAGRRFWGQLVLQSLRDSINLDFRF
jgi:putative peptide zinc metalloprotease protein